MLLNHLDLPVTDVVAAKAFFQDQLGFRELFARGSELAVLSDEAGFALTLSGLAGGDLPAWPTGFHVGFNFGTKAEVTGIHEQLRAIGVPIIRRLGELHGALTFQCLAPGDVIVEFGAWPVR